MVETTSKAAFFEVRSTSVFPSSKSVPFGLWQRTQLVSRIGRMSLSKSTPARAAGRARASRQVESRAEVLIREKRGRVRIQGSGVPCQQVWEKERGVWGGRSLPLPLPLNPLEAPMGRWLHPEGGRLRGRGRGRLRRARWDLSLPTGPHAGDGVAFPVVFLPLVVGGRVEVGGVDEALDQFS